MRGRLALLFPGTGGKPRDYRAMADHAAALGYHALVLSYPNDASINQLAGDDLALHLPLRLDHWDGGCRTGMVDLESGEAILDRLVLALGKLALQYPEQGWDGYVTEIVLRERLDDRQVRAGLADLLHWPKIAAIGHSLGGGYAALAASRHALDRAVVMGWADWSRSTGELAHWVDSFADARTSVTRRFALLHERDEMVPCRMATRVAERFCGDGLRASVESGTFPWGGARLLSTDFDPSQEGSTKTPCHNCLALDVCTPRWPDGSAVLEDVWSWMLTGDVK
ncbi:MAG: hypothetical protein RL318_10 [Fibrobacterota bacterium]